MDFIILYPKNSINTICIHLTNVSCAINNNLIYSNCTLYASKSYRLAPKLFDNVKIINTDYKKFMTKICKKDTTIIGGLSNLEIMEKFTTEYKCKMFVYKEMLGVENNFKNCELVKKMLANYFKIEKNNFVFKINEMKRKNNLKVINELLDEENLSKSEKKLLKEYFKRDADNCIDLKNDCVDGTSVSIPISISANKNNSNNKTVNNTSGGSGDDEIIKTKTVKLTKEERKLKYKKN